MFPNVDNGRFHVEEDGTLVVDTVHRSDAGEYTCHALSRAGSVETTIRIDVRGRLPSMSVSQPVNHTHTHTRTHTHTTV